MKLLVLGGGAQGRVIAADLARTLPQSTVHVADLRAPQLPVLGNLSWIEADLQDADAMVKLMLEHDLVVGALPSQYGYGVMRAAIAARRPLVDVSFCGEDPLTLNREAAAAGIAILPDAGLAPGLSHLIAGRMAAARGTPEELVILVGGVAQDKTRPYGYTVTWSVDDLLEEYTRPARIVRDGQPVEVPVFTDLRRETIPGAGEMESFLSDGLRTLIDTMPGVRDMAEKTLRWPGHVEAIQPLLASGRLVEEFRARCTFDPPEDLVALVVRARWGAAAEESVLVDRYDPATRMTAMSRTTALTTSACARLLASGYTPMPGVQPLDRIAHDAKAYDFIRDAMARHGIQIGDRTATPASH